MTPRALGRLWLVWVSAAWTAPAPGAAATGVVPVRVEYFYTPGCDECQLVEQDVLPALLEWLGEWVDLRRCDVTVSSNILRLAALEETLGVRASDRVSVFVEGRLRFGGAPAIRDGLLPAVEQLVLERLEGRAAAGPAVAPEPGPAADAVLRRRLAAWTPAAVALAGLADGFNPCAFTTLIVFVTLLAAAGARSRDLLRVGAGFCGAVFATYGLLGFGLLNAVRLFPPLVLSGRVFRGLMAAALAGFSLLSFRDAWAFGRSGRPDALVLRLPGPVLARIHAVLRRSASGSRLLLGSAAAGGLVTLLESVCTGQLYVPTLVYLSRQAESRSEALGLLALYNAMFLAPHAVVFAAAYRGLTHARLLAWSRGHVVWSKLALGAVFAALAALMIWA